MSEEAPLYNSRLSKMYLEYIREYYPEVNIASILEYAGIARYEIEDPAHWFSQRQVDLFQEIVSAKTSDSEISRKVGRYAVSSKSLGAGKQYTLGLINLTTVYLLMERLYPIVSRAVTVKTKKLGPNKVEIICTPKEGVEEKPYQCENRKGIFEALGKWFTEDFATIEHPSCFHQGDECCHYIISWKRSGFAFWKMLRNYSILITVLGGAACFLFLPLEYSLAGVLFFGLISMCLALYSGHLENRELTKTIQSQGDASKDLLEEMNIRYNNALLIQEIGQSTSKILDTKKLTKTVVNLMEKRLDFDRGMIMLANKDNTRLLYSAGYGYSKEDEGLLKGTEFHLDKPDARGIFVQSFKEKNPILIDDIMEDGGKLSKRSLEIARKMGVTSLICVPIVFENECFGILAVDNVQSKRPLLSSDINLLMGIAWQTASNIMEVKSFEKLQESEKKYRDLVENANSIILRTDIKGNVTFFNEFAQNFFGYPQQEILGKNIIGTILPDTEAARQSFRDLVSSLRFQGEEGQRAIEKEYLLSNGKTAWIAWTNKAIFDKDGRLLEILSIGNDLTEIRNLEDQLRKSQKMEAIGTLAGGIAHDFNNVLQAILGYTEILRMRGELSEQHSSILNQIEKSAQRASDLTQRLLIFSRKTESKLKPIHLTHEVQQVSKILQRTIPKMIHIELDLAEDIKVINADAVQIEQILMNMAINARDAMPEGGKLRIETRNVILDKDYCEGNLKVTPGEYVLLKISDTGKGMEEKIVEHIFEPFFTTKETGKGTGLGLAMVYGIVENHGGYITCESEPEIGTTFNIYFPIADREVEVSSIDKVRVQLKGGNETILLVDDEAGIRESIGEILTSFGYKPVFAADGESALETYTQKKIDLVLLDLVMPGMGGKQCLARLMEMDPQAKVIVASGQYVDPIARKEIEWGSKGFLSKPYETGYMLNLIREVLDRT